MSKRVYLRISYGHGLDKSMAEYLGTDAEGCQLYRVWREPFRRGDPERVDVLRLRPQEGPGFDFVGTADPARPGTAYFTFPSESSGLPSHEAFRRQLEEDGCVLEHEWSSGNALYLVYTHPAGLAVEEWYARMLRESIGIAPDELREYLFDRQRARDQEQVRERTRRNVKRTLSRFVGALASLAAVVLTIGLIVGIVGGGLTQMAGAAPGSRPRVAAIWMLVTLAPLLLTRDGRKAWPLVAVCGAIAFTLVTLLDGSSPSYGAAAALAAIYALCLGFASVYFGIFSLFSSSTQQMSQVVFGFVLPLLGSAISAAVVAVTSAAAAGRADGFGSGARTVAIALTALLLFAPAAVFASYAGAIIREKHWRAHPKLAVQALASLPLTMVPMLIRVGIPIALLWVVAWLIATIG